MSERISVPATAKLMGVTPLTVRFGILEGSLPIGTAIKVSEKRTIYHVCPQKLADYLGIPVEKVADMHEKN